ncbi:MAG: hypothetical protein K2K15_04805 [Anaeroplasmataceae bacterium]|nr:hypothetical protein [Anaeroplasmataceae bacterium]
MIYRRFKPLLIKLFKEKNIEFNTIAEVDDAKTAILLASPGLGITLAPQSAYHIFEHLNLNVSIVQEENLETNLCVIARKNEKLPIAYENFIKSIKGNEL